MQSLAEEKFPEKSDIAKEFEEFSYIVSHDLGAPLRHIREFTRLLLKARSDVEAETDENERQYGHYIEQSIERMDQMMEALLAYSRVTTRGSEFEKTDCNVLMKNVFESFGDKIKTHNTKIECVSLPVIFGDPVQIETVFRNLLDNALKFHESGADIRVSLSGQTRENDVLFEMRDNGIGMAPEYHSEVFRMFRRLHAPGEYEGTGAGLTIARKIILRHGGSISIASQASKGTAVFFSLPKSPS